MGRRRKNELKPGDNVTIYIPQDVEREVLHFMRTQANLSKTVFKILETYVLRKTRDYIEFDDFYTDRSDSVKQVIKEDNLRRSLDTKDFDTKKPSLENELKEFIRSTIRSEMQNVLGVANEQIPAEKSEIKSRHEDKLKMVQNLEYEEMGRQRKKNNGEMEDLFNEFSKSIEEESEKKIKSVEISKNYLWEDE